MRQTSITQEEETLQGVVNIPMERALELDITYACNMSCTQCNRALGLLPSKAMMTVKQVSGILRESSRLSQPYTDIRILGGEPTLHPHLFAILDEAFLYKSVVPDSTVSLWSHGYGNKVQERLDALPSWLEVKKSPKLPIVGSEQFDTFLAAPVDHTDENSAAFYDGCSYIGPGRTGVGVTVYGIYVCPVAGAIDRVVGLDVGLRNLSEVTMEAFRKQCDSLCRYCGHFLVDSGLNFDRKTISPTWRKFREAYRKHQPVLTILGT